ncbi:MAG TPA: hypothetical protein VFX96_02260 [Pyrinomonadaceae bacterium]|nr:hypothetical protein [Pyrinomonadaceae bacterium]
MLRVVILCLLLSMAGAGDATVAAQEPRDAVTDGAWEGVIEDPARPVVVEADFGSGKARLHAGGPTPLPLEKLPTQAGHIRFRVTAGERVFSFEGERSGGTKISGAVSFGERRLPFWLERLPTAATPRDRVEAWQQDLDAMLNRFLRYDRSFSADDRAAFRERIAGLRRSLRTKSDQEVMVELARAVALSGNAHTRLYLMRNRTEVRRLPLRVWWFKDRLHIVRAGVEQKELLGCRVLKVGAMDIATATMRVRGIDAGNASWQRYMSAYFLTSPDVLFGAGVIPSPEQVALTVSCGNKRRDVRLSPLPLRRETAPVEAWWALVPAYQEPNTSLTSALRTDAAPRYLRNAQKNYWFEYVPELRAIYLQYNRSQPSREGPSMKEFTDGLVREVEQRRPAALIFDLRFNTGGNLEVATPLVRTVSEKLGGVQVFIITGRATFSAGITHVVQLKQWTRATIVGEPVGDGLDTWSEGGNLTLPNSKLTAHYANAFHSYSRREYPAHRPYVLDLDVASVAPDVLVEPSWADYIRGRDPVLDAVAARITASRRGLSRGTKSPGL